MAAIATCQLCAPYWTFEGVGRISKVARGQPPGAGLSSGNMLTVCGGWVKPWRSTSARPADQRSCPASQVFIEAAQSVRGGGPLARPVKLVELDAILSGPEGYEEGVPVNSAAGDFILAFDDSGGIEQLCDWEGNPIAGDHPITLLAGFLVATEAVPKFERLWNELRVDIGSHLGCPPPPIHLRLMWGKSVKRKYRGGDNPYVYAEFDSIQAWLVEAWAIVDDLVRNRQAEWFWMEGNRASLASAQSRFIRDSNFRQELDLIKARSRKLYRGYHRIITSPLLGLYTDALRNADEIMRAAGPVTTLDVLVDSFADSHGIDALATVEEMKVHGGIERIGTVSRVENSDQSPLVQAADLIGYSMFRNQMMNYRHISEDVPFRSIAGNKSGQSLSPANIPHRVRKRYRDRPQTALTMHYALARAFVESKDPEFANQYLIPVDEFDRRAFLAINNNAAGVSVLAHPLADPFNLRDKMPKTPD